MSGGSGCVLPADVIGVLVIGVGDVVDAMVEWCAAVDVRGAGGGCGCGRINFKQSSAASPPPPAPHRQYQCAAGDSAVCSTSSRLANAQAPIEEPAIRLSSSPECAKQFSSGGRHA